MLYLLNLGQNGYYHNHVIFSHSEKIFRKLSSPAVEKTEIIHTHGLKKLKLFTPMGANLTSN